MTEKTNTVNSLQEVINKRASKRLIRDLLNLSEYISQNRLLYSNELDMPKLFIKNSDNPALLALIDGEKNTKRVYLQSEFSSAPFHNMFAVSSSTSNPSVSGAFAKYLYSFWLPKYIEEETQTFIERIDDLKEDVEYLLDNSER